MASYALPTHRISVNVKASLTVFEEQYTWERVIPGIETTRTDHYTDSLMLGQAISCADVDLLQKTFGNYYPHAKTGTADQWLVRYYQLDTQVAPAKYTRYWHGYLVALKPLLVVFKYQEILLLNQLLQGLLALLLLVLAYRRHGFPLAFGVVLVLVFSASFAIPYALQYSWIFYLALIASILILKFGKSIDSLNAWPFLFLIIGCLTSYVDMLTYPTFTLCLPLLLALCEVPSKKRLKVVLTSALAWGFGYVAMWCSKWILSSIVLGQNMFPTDRITMRSSTTVEGQSIGFLEVIALNLSVYNNPVYIGFGIASILVMLYCLVHNWGSQPVDFRSFLPFLLVALIPLAWIFISTNHSYIHFWMTFRNLSIIPMAILLLLLYLFGCNADAKGKHSTPKDADSNLA